VSPLTLLPAVDLIGGQAVQLVQGVADSAKVFGDPVAAARRWQTEGATWIHLVDLDAAFGRGSNADVVARVLDAVDLNVELSGGIRDQTSLERALAAGCARVNLGTAALERPEWCRQAIATDPERVAISLDVQRGRVAGRGWTTSGDLVEDVVERLNAYGCRRYVVTDIASDGTLQGPNIELLRRVGGLTNAALTASGGIATLQDVARLGDLTDAGVDAAIIGTALYVGNFTLAAALSLVAAHP
jgi:phosphoribosylanthranilate isomerase